MGTSTSMLRVVVVIVVASCTLMMLCEAKPRRSAKDWDRIAREAADKQDKEEMDERQKPASTPSFDPDSLKQPGGMERLMASQKAGKPAMVFVTVLTKNKQETEDFAGKSRAILKE